MSGELTGYKGEIVGSPEYFIELNNRNFMECVVWPLSTHKHYACVKKLAGSINRILLEVFRDLQKREKIRYCVHPNWWELLFELLSDLDNIVKMAGGSSCYEEIVKLVESGYSGDGEKVSVDKINKLRAIKEVIRNQYSEPHADIVVRELRKAVQYGIAGITDVKLRKALSSVYQGALQLMGEQEFWEGLLAMYMYCSPDSNYNGYFKGYSNILICSENYFFYIVERAIGRRWTYEDNHFYKELMHDFYEILEIVKEDLNRGLQNEMDLKQENADRLSGFFDDLEKLGFSVTGGRGLLKEIRIEIEGPGDTYVTAEQLKQLGWSNITNEMVKGLNNTLVKYDITTPERIRHFISQAMHESGLGIYTKEIASGNAYEGRTDLGNTQPGDGAKYKGVGYIQMTGRANYQAFADYMGDHGIMKGVDYVSAKYTWEAAGFWWHDNGMNAIVDSLAGTSIDQQTLEISRAVNRGNRYSNDMPNHYKERRGYYILTLDIIK